MQPGAERPSWKHLRSLTNRAGAKFFLRAVLRGVVAGALSYAFLRFFMPTFQSSAVIPLIGFSVAGLLMGVVGWVFLVRGAKEQYAAAIGAVPPKEEGLPK